MTKMKIFRSVKYLLKPHQVMEMGGIDYFRNALFLIDLRVYNNNAIEFFYADNNFNIVRTEDAMDFINDKYYEYQCLYKEAVNRYRKFWQPLFKDIVYTKGELKHADKYELDGLKFVDSIVYHNMDFNLDNHDYNKYFTVLGDGSIELIQEYVTINLKPYNAKNTLVNIDGMYCFKSMKFTLYSLLPFKDKQKDTLFCILEQWHESGCSARLIKQTDYRVDNENRVISWKTDISECPQEAVNLLTIAIEDFAADNSCYLDSLILGEIEEGWEPISYKYIRNKEYNRVAIFGPWLIKILKMHYK